MVPVGHRPEVAVRWALRCDPVDAAADAEYLAEMLGARYDMVLRLHAAGDRRHGN